MFIAVIERPDGTCYEQPFKDYSEIVFLITHILGEGYEVVDIY